ncbi:restriction endonuclease [Jeotgalibacillus aurantiacus]|uniref:restriction endonuclease n=1 Tax=Jeotgalibacillus aurantiacus TaxID=2763266 RepID=UPI001D0BAB99|nr:restriction endonuclease [Jeotgalibacillus aurantiacus]
MLKKQRKNISNTISMIYLLVGLYVYWIILDSSNIYLLMGLILSTPFVDRIVYSILPAKEKSNRKRSGSSSRSQQKQSTNQLRSDREIIASKLENLSWREFERLCFLYYEAKGYKPRETGKGADGGVDLIIYHPRDKAQEAIQIKHYIGSGNRIGVEKIRELHAAKRNHKCILATFITTSGYTKNALAQAEDFKIKCHNIDWVENKIVRWQEERKKVG